MFIVVTKCTKSKNPIYGSSCSYSITARLTLMTYWRILSSSSQDAERNTLHPLIQSLAAVIRARHPFIVHGWQSPERGNDLQTRIILLPHCSYISHYARKLSLDCSTRSWYLFPLGPAHRFQRQPALRPGMGVFSSPTAPILLRRTRNQLSLNHIWSIRSSRGQPSLAINRR